MTSAPLDVSRSESSLPIPAEAPVTSTSEFSRPAIQPWPKESPGNPQQPVRLNPYDHPTAYIPQMTQDAEVQHSFTSCQQQWAAQRGKHKNRRAIAILATVGGRAGGGEDGEKTGGRARGSVKVPEEMGRTGEGMERASEASLPSYKGLPERISRDAW
eukprot:763269-Hanusia_phi.AAC.3